MSAKQPTLFQGLLECLVREEVDFVVIGGVAGIFHGLARFTSDLDVMYSRDERNIERLVRALADTNPYLRGAPPGLPFFFDALTIRNGLNFTLATRLGAIDLLGEVPGASSYDSVRSASLSLRTEIGPINVVDLGQLIQLKRAAGRPKDLEVIAELELLRDRLNR